MKTIRNTKTGEIKRVDDKDANNMVKTKWQGWEYCPKSLWKTEVRGSVKVESKKVEKTTSENLGRGADGRSGLRAASAHREAYRARGEVGP